MAIIYSQPFKGYSGNPDGFPKLSPFLLTLVLRLQNRSRDRCKTYYICVGNPTTTCKQKPSF